MGSVDAVDVNGRHLECALGTTTRVYRWRERRMPVAEEKSRKFRVETTAILASFESPDIRDHSRWCLR